MTFTTDNLNAVTSVQDFIGKEQAHAYLLNHGAHGYAKFVLDERTIRALEKDLYKIKSSLDRKQLYSILYDMTISGKIPGIRVVEIMKHNIQFSESEDIITEVFRSSMPPLLKKYIPPEVSFKIFDEMFGLVMDILGKGYYKESASTQELLFSSLVDFA